MATTTEAQADPRAAEPIVRERLYIGGQWVPARGTRTPDVIDFAATAQLLRERGDGEERIGNALVVREPAGVVGCITPWNYPLHQIAVKVAPAIAAGCTVVLKPSEVTPLNAFVLAEVIDAAGLPGGAFNLVTGLGPVVGEAISTSPGIDVISFTG